MMKFAGGLFYHARFRRALLEGAALVLALLGVFQLGRKPALNNLTTLALELGTLPPLWLALRTRLPGGGWKGEIGKEMLRALAAGALALCALLVLSAAAPFSPDNLYYGASYGLVGGLLAGMVYLAGRAGLRLWFLWRAACRRNIALALTHAQVGLAALAALLAIGLVALLGISNAFYLSRSHPDTLLRTLSGEMQKVFLASGVIAALACPAMLLMVGIFGVFSYFFTRRLTRRLQALAAAADGLRQKDHRARVQVEGEDEIARVQSSFNQMAGELTQALEALQSERDRVQRLLDERRQLFASVSHELRTPLAVLQSAHEAAQEAAQVAAQVAEGVARRAEPDDAGAQKLAETQRHLRTMEHQIERLQRQLDDLFSLAQVEAARLEVTCRPLALDGLAQGVVEQLAPGAWRAYRVEMVFQSLDGPLTVLADSGRLEQALVNLARNALRYCAPGGLVVVQTQRREGLAALHVRDTGSGINADDLAHIWERFYRAERQPGEMGERNAGLGLALVKEFVEAMGGSAAVESAPGEGSCFTLTLQLAE